MANWTAAYASLNACLTAVTIAAGDRIYMAADHSGSESVNRTYTGLSTDTAPIELLSVNRTTGVLQVGAAMSFSASAQCLFQGNWAIFGLAITTADSRIQLNSGTVASAQSLFRCSLTVSASANGIETGPRFTASIRSICRLIGCTFSGAGAVLKPGGGLLEIFNGTLTAGVSAIHPGQQAEVYFSGCDFSAATNLLDISNNHFWSVRGRASKIPASITTGTYQGRGAGTMELHACSGSDNSYDYYYRDAWGTPEEDTGVYLTTGGSAHKNTDGALVPYSVKVATTSRVSKFEPAFSPWITKFHAATGSATFSLKVAYDNATVLTDSELWLEVEYMGGAAADNTPQTQLEVSAPLVSGLIARNLLAAGSNLSDTSDGWTGTSGWSNKKTHTLSKTVTVDEQGHVRCRVGVAKNYTVYVDGKIGVA